jgi:hypothetical protein
VNSGRARGSKGSIDMVPFEHRCVSGAQVHEGTQKEPLSFVSREGYLWHHTLSSHHNCCAVCELRTQSPAFYSGGDDTSQPPPQAHAHAAWSSASAANVQASTCPVLSCASCSNHGLGGVTVFDGTARESHEGQAAMPTTPHSQLEKCASLVRSATCAIMRLPVRTVMGLLHDQRCNAISQRRGSFRL